ncbi:MAG: AMP-binding protein [Chitinophagales bacterium]
MFTIDFALLSDEQLRSLCAQKLLQDLSSWELKIWSFLAQWLDPDVPGITVHTSGSTSAPRPFTHTKASMQASAGATCRFLAITEGKTALLALPADKIGGMMMVVRSWLYKLRLICIAPSANPCKDLPMDAKVDFAAFTPMQIVPAIESYNLYKRAEAIGVILLGGSDVPHGLEHWIKSMTNRVYATFGMTETVSHIALKKLNPPEADAHFRLVPGVDISTDERGCLQITAPALALHNLQTNDVVRLTGPDSFDWLGRYDNVINTGGLKVYPEVLESELKDAVLVPFFIAGVPDGVTGEKVVMVIERDTITEKELDLTRNYLQQLNKTTRPRQLLIVPRFVKTETGKIKRKESLARVDACFDL